MPIRELDIDGVRAGLADDEILVVDVREPEEFAAGHIPGAVSLPMSRFHPDDLPDPEGRRIVLSCAAGGRSLRLLQALESIGHPVDTHYVGGFRDWLGQGGEVER